MKKILIYLSKPLDIYFMTTMNIILGIFQLDNINIILLQNCIYLKLFFFFVLEKGGEFIYLFIL